MANLGTAMGLSKRLEGKIGYFDLANWFVSEFSDKERKHIFETFRPLGSSGDSLASGTVLFTSQTAVSLLCSLAGWFSKETDRPIAYKLLRKAEELAETESSILDAHFLYGQKLAIYYKDREKAGCLEKAVQACNQQIAIGEKAAEAFRKEFNDPLPSHMGYKQLAIILEKQGDFDKTIVLCQKAHGQGWAGDWEKRIDRCRKKIRQTMINKR